MEHEIPTGLSDQIRQRLFPRYVFQFSAQQLCFLCKCLADTKDIQGSVAEIGCEYGHTTVFLNNYLDDIRAGGDKRKYFALDTFRGFPVEDIQYEVRSRFKFESMYSSFRTNKKEWFEQTMKDNGAFRVNVIEADVNEFDLTALQPLSFVLLDVDLYRPIKKALPELYKALSPGGIMIVDDCDSSDFFWDGSYQAYMEFVQSLNLTPRIVYKKLGVIRKPELPGAARTS